MHGCVQPSVAVLIPLPTDLPEQVARALREDIGAGDVTAVLIPAERTAHARVLCREAAVLCGAAWFEASFRQLDAAVQVLWHVAEGADVGPNTILCELHGPARALLTGERTALNFLQLLSATATRTRAFARAVEGTGCRILDTRKTIPGLRSAQKYAVRCGGGDNHRMGLFDMVLIKENHIAAAGSIAAAVAAARATADPPRVEVEVEALGQVREALDAGADIILLDNFDLVRMQAAVAMNRAHPRPCKLECSGGITLDNVRAIAASGVDYVSVGALTKHIAAVDLSMRIDAGPA